MAKVKWRFGLCLVCRRLSCAYSVLLKSSLFVFSVLFGRSRLSVLMSACVVGIMSSSFSVYADMAVIGGGEYRAIVIGNNNYKDPIGVWKPLETAVNDAKSVAETLKSNYGFEDVLLLIDATRRDILRALTELKGRVKKEDSVLIYYAGHGHRNDDTDEAYWIPVDAEGSDDSFFLSNARIIEKLKVISRRVSHTLLVSDSCFSGSLLRGGNRGVTDKERDEPFLKKMASRKSVQIVAAGGIEFVDDNYNRSGHSPFTYFFLNELNKNNETYLTATELSSTLTRLVANNVFQTPQNGILHGAGDEGGEFIFRRRNLLEKYSSEALGARELDPRAIELSYWDSVKDSGDAEMLDSYIQRYPEGIFVDIARRRMQLLKKNNLKPNIDSLLKKAEGWFGQGWLTSPPNQNARDLWLAALSIDPDNKVARQGLIRTAKKLVQLANEEIDAGNLSTAAELINDAEDTAPGLSEIRIARKRLQNIGKPKSSSKGRPFTPVPVPGF